MENKKRNIAIDYYKAFLVIFMISAHIIQLVGTPNELEVKFSDFVNLTTFSGFMFCFGYTTNVAYLSKENLPHKKIFKGFLKTLTTFYIAGIFSIILVQKNMSPKTFTDLLSLQELPSYTEFLCSFAYLYLIIIVFGKGICKITKSLPLTLLFIALSMLSAFIDPDINRIRILGPVVGGYMDYYFPLMQYFAFYLIGARFADRISKPLFAISAVSAIVIKNLYSFNELSEYRFPPKFLFILTGMFFVYVIYTIVYGICHIINKSNNHDNDINQKDIYASAKGKSNIDKNHNSKYKFYKLVSIFNNEICFISKNTIYYLLFSNIIIFVISYLKLVRFAAYETLFRIAILVFILIITKAILCLYQRYSLLICK